MPFRNSSPSSPIGRRRPKWSAIVIIAIAWSSACGASPASAILFDFINGDDAGEGFNDPLLGAARQSAFQYALNIWGGLLAPSYDGQSIRVRATFDPLGGDLNGATGAQAGSQYIFTDGAQWYPAALANHLVQENLLTEVGQFEIVAQINSDVDDPFVLGASNWYYGTDGQPGANIDFISVALHEIAHGLGFTTHVDSQTGAYFSYLVDLGDGPEMISIPSLFDTFLVNDAVALDALSDMTDAERLAAATSDNVYWAGEYGTAANGGERPKIYAPGMFAEGSSLSHLDEAVHGLDLMSPTFHVGEVIHTPSAITLGMLRDMGWTLTAVPEPSSMLLVGLVGLGGAIARQRKKRRALQTSAI